MVGKIVFDNSAMMPLFLPDEDPTIARRILTMADDTNPLVCPSLWIYEFGNVLATALRRKRISSGDVAEILRLAKQLPIRVVSPPLVLELGFQVATAQRLGLSLYDTSYIVLAYNERAALATNDKAMQKAARELGVELV